MKWDWKVLEEEKPDGITLECLVFTYSEQIIRCLYSKHGDTWINLESSIIDRDIMIDEEDIYKWVEIQVPERKDDK